MMGWGSTCQAFISEHNDPFFGFVFRDRRRLIEEYWVVHKESSFFLFFVILLLAAAATFCFVLLVSAILH